MKLCAAFLCERVITDRWSCPSPGVEQRTKTPLRSKCRWARQQWCWCWYSTLQKHTSMNVDTGSRNRYCDCLLFGKVKCYVGKCRKSEQHSWLLVLNVEAVTFIKQWLLFLFQQPLQTSTTEKKLCWPSQQIFVQEKKKTFKLRWHILC